MARCIFENLTPHQAEELANWFEEQGEQDCLIWFEHRDMPNPMVDVSDPDCIRNEGDDVIVKCFNPL